MRYLLGLLVVVVAVCVFVVPLRKIVEREYAAQSESWGKWEMRLVFSPSFQSSGDDAWPKTVNKGSPYRVSVMLVGPMDAAAETLTVESLKLSDAGNRAAEIVLPAKTSAQSAPGTDGHSYAIVAHDAIAVDWKSVHVAIKCRRRLALGAVEERTFEFEVQRRDRTHWVNAIWQALMGI